MDLADRLRAALADRYEIERELGRGGMAVVHLARDLKHDRHVAIKVLRPEVSAALGADRFLREIQIAAKLQHPHILTLHDSGQADGLLYYVMPYVEGESLRQQLLREKQLPLNDALQIAREVADALSYAHSHDIVHRDIKPENVLLSGGHAMVADFGIARAISAAAGEPLTDSGVAIGTPAYMSPEQGTGEADLDGRTDTYALGCVLFEMLAGEPPFTGPTSQAIIARHVSERPPSLRIVRPTIPEAIEKAIERALAKVPADRFGTASEFADGLAAASGARKEPRLTMHSRRVLFALFAALILPAAWVAVQAWRDSTSSRTANALAPDPNHIAILYFMDRSDNGTLRSVADGLTQDLIDELTRVQPLRVASASQVEAYRGTAVELDSLVSALNVGTLVEGFVAGDSTRFSITVRLVDGATGKVLGSHEFEGVRNDLLAVRDEIVREVAEVLRRQLGEQVELRSRLAETSNVDAWLLVQQAEEVGKYASELNRAGDGSGTRRALGQADSIAAQAEALDQDWIVPIVQRGWLAWSNAILTQVYPALSKPSGEPSFSGWIGLGLEHARRALEKRPADPRALELRGSLRLRLWSSGYGANPDSLLGAAERDLRGAVAADPSLARSWYALSRLLESKGEHTEAEVAARMALEKDAYLAEARPVMRQLFWTTLNRGDFEEAKSWCDEGRRRFAEDPNFVECWLTILGWTADEERQIEEAWREVATIDEDRSLASGAPYRRLLVAAILARARLRDSAVAVVRRARAEFPAEPMYIQEAYVRLLLGEVEEALRLLALFVQEFPTHKGYVESHFWFQKLRGEERFKQLVARDRR